AHLTQDELYKRHICGHHFLNKDLTSFNKCRFVEIDNIDPLKTYSVASKFPSSSHQVFEIKRTQLTSTASFYESAKIIRLKTLVKSTKYSTSQSNISTPEISLNTTSFFKVSVICH
ncbi:Uncharacterized protein FWK35_00000133, partial [Aphis craccivora]